VAASPDASFDIGHPAPHRGQVGTGALAFTLLAAPVAWSLQLLLIYGFASHFCGPEPVPASNPDWLLWLLPVVNVAALGLAALAIWLSLRHLQRTRSEQADQSGGIMDAGEGRTRFLSVWGVWIGIVFLLAIAFNTISVFWTGLCGT
jgi:hypothetical protein